MTGYSVYALLEKYFPLDRMVLFFRADVSWKKSFTAAVSACAVHVCASVQFLLPAAHSSCLVFKGRSDYAVMEQGKSQKSSVGIAYLTLV